MLLGATGTGKSTMVDGFINYILGVEWNDPFRFTAIDLEKEEKDRVNNQVTLKQHGLHVNTQVSVWQNYSITGRKMVKYTYNKSPTKKLVW